MRGPERPGLPLAGQARDADLRRRVRELLHGRVPDFRVRRLHGLRVCGGEPRGEDQRVEPGAHRRGRASYDLGPDRGAPAPRHGVRVPYHDTPGAAGGRGASPAGGDRPKQAGLGGQAGPARAVVRLARGRGGGQRGAAGVHRPLRVPLRLPSGRRPRDLAAPGPPGPTARRRQGKTFAARLRLEAGGAVVKPTPDANPKTHRAILALLSRLPPGAAVLDVPCGSGALTWELLRRGYTATPGDASPRRYQLPAPPCHAVDLNTAIPFPDNAFDAAVCCEGPQVLENPAQAFREFARVLTPGGMLVVALPNVANLFSRG